MPAYRAQYTSEERRHFGRLVAQKMKNLGLNNSELAQRASLKMAGKKKIGRDSISRYINGQSVPSPVHLNAIAEALDMMPSTLLPRAHDQAHGEAPPPRRVEPNELRTQELPDNRVHIQLDRYLPWNEAMEILEILRKVSASRQRK